MASRSVKQSRTQMMGTGMSAPKPSLTSSIRSAVASRKPAATTGVARAVAQAATDRNGNRLGPRPKVGEADPATRRAALQEALKPGPPVKRSAPKPAPAPLDGQGGPGNQRRRRVIDETVDRMSR